MRSNGESGQTILIVALVLVVLILAAGLAIDIGYMRYQRRLVQMAADSAAIAGAANMIAGAANVNCTGANCLPGEAGTNSGYNGFNPASAGTTITVSNPPADGAYAGNATYVEASITQSVPMFFVKALGSSFGSFPVTARAVAYPGPSPSCIYTLGQGLPPQGGLLYSGSSTQVQGTSCAVNDGGDACIPNTDSSYTLHVLGLVYAGSTCTPFGSLDTTPVHGAPAGNPLPYLLNNTPSTSGGGPNSSCPPYTYCAGTYPMGISINGTGQNISFQPGRYILGGSGLSISGSGQVTGNNVLFYTNGTGTFSINAGADYANDTCGPSPTNTTGMTVQLSASTDSTDPYGGILFIQDDSQPSSAPASAITLNNGDTCNTEGRTLTSTPPSSYLWGMLYLPNTSVTLNGIGLDNPNPTLNECSNIPRFTIVVAYALTLTGNVNFSVSDCGSTTPYQFTTVLPSPLPDPIKDAVLVE